jgi:hypothetical protein
MRRQPKAPPHAADVADERPGRGPRLTREALEAEQRDEDARGPS